MKKDFFDLAVFIVQLLSLAALIIYVIKTWEMASATKDAAIATANTVKEMEKSRELLIAPQMIAYLDANDGSGTLDLCLENLGNSGAENLTLEVNPPFLSSFDQYGHSIHNLKVFTDGVPLFPPHYKLVIPIDMLIHHYSNDSNNVAHKVCVKYESKALNKVYNHDFILDSRIFYGILRGDNEKSIESNLIKILQKINYKTKQ